ncbi:hypothetical protein [Verrucosispora sp. WMMD573]|uniref:hypothetical protein n=1 Tax=Verrucosispora sp. WMMD573 TaxID=3015149 RepID=UPI00248D35B8|nr:hypothetical protein [Verrucosispora sp. WMMD573]WBB51983.1 hypothetical protein O7601_15265 [Verrucosispora sp. WMMD573]
MTTRLREVLRVTAAQVPAYQVEQRALATAARRGRPVLDLDRPDRLCGGRDRRIPEPEQLALWWENRQLRR